MGGNRLKWDEVASAAGIQIHVTAVENDIHLCELYQERFPDDLVIHGDAHQYLLDHFREFDFIWSSPPCPSHSRAAFGNRKSANTKHLPIYPDLKLYEEIIFLQKYFIGRYCVENVIPYYEPLIPAQLRGRHLYWTNFRLPKLISTRDSSIIQGSDEVNRLCEFHEYDFYKYKGAQRINKIARNLVDYEAGKTIFEAMLNVKKDTSIQTQLF